MDIQILERSATNCVAIDLVKQNKRILHSAEDSLISGYIASAEQLIEGLLNRAIMPTNHRLAIGRILPEIELPRGQLISVLSIKTTPQDGVQTTITPLPDAATACYPNMIAQLKIPAIAEVAAGSMVIEYTSGWANANAVPAAIKQAVVLLACHYHTNRDATFMDPRIMNVEKKIPFGVEPLIRQFEIPNSHIAINGGY